MTKTLKRQLIETAKKKIKNDPSHDFEHAIRVLGLAEQIASQEDADLDIIVPAALFHDLIVYRKDHPKSKNEREESASGAERILKEFRNYPLQKMA